MAGFPLVASIPRPFATVRGIIIGHSRGAFGGYQIQGDATRDRIKAGMPCPYGIDHALYAIGGSAISRRLGQLAWAAAGVPEAASWVDDTGAYPVPGAALASAVAQLNVRDPGNVANHGYLDCGYRDQEAMDGNLGLTSIAARDDYRAALTYMFATLRASSGLTDDAKFLFFMAGRYPAGTTGLGMDIMRQEHLRLIDLYPALYGHATETVGYPLGDGAHESRGGMRPIGANVGDAVLSQIFGINTYTDRSGVTPVERPIFGGPSIPRDEIALVDPYTVDVPIAGNGEDIAWPVQMPGSFAFANGDFDPFAGYSDASPPPVIFPQSASHGASLLRFTLPMPITTPDVTVMFPYNDGAGFNPNGLIRGATSQKLLKSLYRG